MIVSSREIKEVTLGFCKNTLTKNDIRSGYEEEVKLIETLHKERMNKIMEKVTISTKTYIRVMERLKRNNKRSYDYIVKSSDSLKKL